MRFALLVVLIILAPLALANGDADGNGVVNAADLSLVLGHFGRGSFDARADRNQDGVVNVHDLVLVAVQWGSTLETGVCEATGNCHYVAPGGSDANPGTYAQPYGTFLPALSAAQPGDVIYARGGEYGPANTMVTQVYQDPSNTPPDCPRGAMEDGSCFIDHWGFIGIRDLSGYGTDFPPYTTTDGTAQEPITIKAYPGERPVLNASGLAEEAIYLSEKDHWIIEGFEVAHGKIEISGTVADGPHDIIIRNNEVWGALGCEGCNDGLIFIRRVDASGAYNILIHNNTIHDMYNEGLWGDVYGGYQRHLGGVTTMSCESYLGSGCGGTGYIEIINNTFYNLPQAFYFKNAARGPILIRNNTFRDGDILGHFSSRETHFENNLVVNLSGGAIYGGNDLPERSHNSTFINNTIVGLSQLFSTAGSLNHTVRGNIIAGIDTSTAGAGWDTQGLIHRSEITPEGPDPATSALTTYTIEDNCLVATDPNFVYVKRFYDNGGTGIEHYNSTEAAAQFGYGAGDAITITTDLATVFSDPAAGDYTLLPGACQVAPQDGEPTYDPGTHTLIYADDMESYVSIVDMGTNDPGVPSIVPHPSPLTRPPPWNTSSFDLIADGNGGQAIRLNMPGTYQSGDSFFGYRMPTTPATAHHFFTYRARVTPAQPLTGPLSVKWFLAYHSTDRVQWNTHWPANCHDPGENTVWQVYDQSRLTDCQGDQPIGPYFEETADGQWHRFTHEYRPNSAAGARDGISRMWIDGKKIIDISSESVGVTPPGGTKPWSALDDLDALATSGIVGNHAFGWGNAQTTTTPPWTFDIDDFEWWTA